MTRHNCHHMGVQCGLIWSKYPDACRVHFSAFYNKYTRMRSQKDLQFAHTRSCHRLTPHYTIKIALIMVNTAYLHAELHAFYKSAIHSYMYNKEEYELIQIINECCEFQSISIWLSFRIVRIWKTVTMHEIDTDL